VIKFDPIVPTLSEFVVSSLASPKEIAIQGTHDTAIDHIQSLYPPSAAVTILDFGAGQGALSLRLRDLGYTVKACDYFPDDFRVDGIECRKSGDDLAIPYGDDEFDLIVAVELVEHIDGHLTFFKEVARALKPGGTFLLTTPNILSLKSRMTFLFTGYYYSFNTLNPDVHDPVSQHIAPYTVDRYRFILKRAGLTLRTVHTDKLQTSSIFLSFLYPLIWITSRLKFGTNVRVSEQNSRTTLLGRKIILVSEKSTVSARTE
jgi:SAM-dependent methyltransferase